MQTTFYGTHSSQYEEISKKKGEKNTSKFTFSEKKGLF